LNQAAAGFFLQDVQKYFSKGTFFINSQEAFFQKQTRPFPTRAGQKKFYKGGEAEYQRLEEAFALDKAAALKATSWSRFQILGENFRACGYRDVFEYVEAMFQDEDNALEAFCDYVRSEGLVEYLKKQAWAPFARAYNGPAYKRNNYDVKMENAEARYARKGVNTQNLVSRLPQRGLDATKIFQPEPAKLVAAGDATATLAYTSLDDRYCHENLDFSRPETLDSATPADKESENTFNRSTTGSFIPEPNNPLTDNPNNNPDLIDQPFRPDQINSDSSSIVSTEVEAATTSPKQEETVSTLDLLSDKADKLEAVNERANRFGIDLFSVFSSMKSRIGRLPVKTFLKRFFRAFFRALVYIFWAVIGFFQDMPWYVTALFVISAFLYFIYRKQINAYVRSKFPRSSSSSSSSDAAAAATS
jgi:hypothetical protein